MDTIVGIDPASTRAAFVAIHGTKFHIVSYPKLGTSGAVACAAAWHATHEFLESLPWLPGRIDAFIEYPVLGRGGFRSTMVQAFTSGAIQGALHEWGCTVHGANVSKWKKVVVGKGNATKPEVAESILRRWPSLHRAADGNEDLCDAAAIALYGLGVVED